jgi:hypothetical protein
MILCLLMLKILVQRPHLIHQQLQLFQQTLRPLRILALQLKSLLPQIMILYLRIVKILVQPQRLKRVEQQYLKLVQPRRKVQQLLGVLIEIQPQHIVHQQQL